MLQLRLMTINKTMSLPPLPVVMSYDDLGLPESLKRVKLGYNHLTGSIVAHVHLGEGNREQNRLFIRGINDLKYRLITDFAPDISVDCFISCETAPLIYFATRKSTSEGSNWDALYRYHLDTNQLALVMKCGELIIPDQYERGWIVTLHSQSNSNLYCTVGLQRKIDDDNRRPVTYFIAEVSLLTCSVKVISELRRWVV